MRKIILTFFVFAFIANASAQLKVNSSGQVGIGVNPLSTYKLYVSGNTYVTGNMYLGSSASNFFGTIGNNVPPFGEASRFVALEASVHACNKTKFCPLYIKNE